MNKYKRKIHRKKIRNNRFRYYLYNFFCSHFFQNNKKLIITAFIWGVISFLAVVITGICTSINPIQPVTLKNKNYYFNPNGIKLSVDLSWIFLGISIFLAILIHFYEKHEVGRRFTIYPKEFYYPLLSWLTITIFFHVLSIVISYFTFYYPYLQPVPSASGLP